MLVGIQMYFITLAMSGTYIPKEDVWQNDSSCVELGASHVNTYRTDTLHRPKEPTAHLVKKYVRVITLFLKWQIKNHFVEVNIKLPFIVYLITLMYP